MADNVTLNPGSGGSVIATDDDGTAQHEWVKLEWGPDNTFNKVDDTTGKRIPIKLGDIDAALKGAGGGLKVEIAPSTAQQITLQASQVAAVTNGTTTRTITT